MPSSPLDELLAFAKGYRHRDIVVREARGYADERQDGEPVTRLVLVLEDPRGDMWEVRSASALRNALGRKATELDLPPVSVALVAASEAEAIEAPRSP